MDLKNIGKEDQTQKPRGSNVNFPPVCESPRESYISESKGGYTGRGGFTDSNSSEENPITGTNVIDYFEVEEDHNKLE